ncbi:Lipoprotein LpqB [Microbacterium oxydans]|uniref:Lipoprotein LpqB n=1 Tax=Microbacterium oxydans TaxID=82380 RepID=A0A0F0L6R1_9MICO|nr:LpqB family beta-propeller domain-containing protein [Microbacterium oxydans]KJL28379.1 Lipoprotein LpqB precursor [Microbacterium oxydans]CAH0229770.1 Lipoprotein LpqB [Microbacterium oxydans]
MKTRSVTRMLRGVAAVAAALVLSACTGLPMSGDVNVGLDLGEVPEDSDFLFIASGPAPGSGPREIVEGFLEAAISPADNWNTARSFLTPKLQTTWQPGAGVSIDDAVVSRTISSSIPDDEVESADSGVVQVQIDLVASVDGDGSYSESRGPSSRPFTVERTDDGEWRISQAPDGIVIDQARFPRVFDSYALQYFDQSWTHLVPDTRWFPRRTSIATTVTRALVGGSPSPWLEDAVRTAFPADVQLAQDAVLIDRQQVADVALTPAASRLDPTTLARMRTQLQQTLDLADVRVSQVRFTVEGRTLDAGVVNLPADAADQGPVVLTDDAFGVIVGDEVSPIEGISDEILTLPQRVRAVDLARDALHAAVQLADGGVYVVGDGRVDLLDQRPGLIEPSLDPYGYTWTVPAGEPAALTAWSTNVAEHAIAKAWPNASAISALRVSVDGARVAAVITLGGQHWVVVAAIVRDEAGVPVQLGEAKQVTLVDGDARGLVWLGPERLGVLVDAPSPVLLTQLVGGPGVVEVPPTGTVSLAGARTESGIRALDATGTLYAHAGSAWREVATGVQVLATRSGE